MTFEQERAQIRRHLEAAIRLQRESWDEALAIQQLTTNYDRDFYALVAELAGAFTDNEAITADVINSLFAPHPVIYPESALVQ
jgi:hypothetical protein